MTIPSSIAALSLLLAASPPGAPGLVALDPASSALLAADAERTGLAARPEIASQLVAAHTRLAVEQLLLENVRAAAPTDAEVRAEHRASAHAARLQMVVRATRAEADAAQGRLRRGASLADEAKQSVDPATRESAGELGWVARGQLPQLVAADVFKGGVADWRGPYDLGGRWAVVRAMERRTPPDDRKALEAVRSRMIAERRQRAQEAYVARLRERARIPIDEPFVTAAAARPDPSQADREHVVATVGARKLRYGDLVAASTGIRSAHAGAGGSAAMQLEVARQLVDRLLLEDEARRKAPATRPALAKKLRAAREDILVGAYYDELAAKLPAPTPKEVEARYEQRRSDFVAPAARRCAHVVVASEEGAKALRKRAVAGEPFAGLAREASLDEASRSKGGDIGDVSEERLGRMDAALAATIRKLAPAQVSEPTRTRMGWHLLRCEPIPARQRHLVEVEERITGTLRHERTMAALNGRVAELKAAQASGVRKAAR